MRKGIDLPRRTLEVRLHKLQQAGLARTTGTAGMHELTCQGLDQARKASAKTCPAVQPIKKPASVQTQHKLMKQRLPAPSYSDHLTEKQAAHQPSPEKKEVTPMERPIDQLRAAIIALVKDDGPITFAAIEKAFPDEKKKRISNSVYRLKSQGVLAQNSSKQYTAGNQSLPPPAASSKNPIKVVKPEPRIQANDHLDDLINATQQKINARIQQLNDPVLNALMKAKQSLQEAIEP